MNGYSYLTCCPIYLW